MTSGLDDGVADVYCTDPACLQYLADAGTRWAYHNGPYTNLTKVVEAASGQNYNVFYFNRLASKTGMGGLWLYVGYNRLLLSNARTMARFGLLIQNGGSWDGTPVLSDADYVESMITPSQTLNKSYGYLWWLNGQESYKLPGLQLDFPGSICPDAPADMYAAMGANGQFLNIVPSEGLVLVRMGDAPNGDLVPALLNNEIWQYVNDLVCEPNAVMEEEHHFIQMYPNPVEDKLYFKMPDAVENISIHLYDALGRKIKSVDNNGFIDVRLFKSGIYYYQLLMDGKLVAGRFVKK